MRWRVRNGLVILVWACGPSSADAPGSTTETSSGGPNSETSAATSQSATTSAGDATGAGGTTSTSSGAATTSTETGPRCDAGDDDTGQPPSVCEPQPIDVVVDVDFDMEVANGDSELDLHAPCVIDALVQVEPVRLRIEMTCVVRGEQVPEAVEVASDPPVVLPLAVGDFVDLRAAEVVPIDTGGYECVALQDSEGALVVGQYELSCPSELVTPSVWFVPIALEFRMDVCEPEPYEMPPGCDFIQEPCTGQVQRGAFAVDVGEDSALVYDRGTATIAGFDVRVSHAEREVPDDAEFCGRGPFDRGTVVVQRPAE